MTVNLGEHFKMEDFRNVFKKMDNNEGKSHRCRCSFDRRSAWSFFNRMFPCYRIMKKYNWKTDFVADLICGFTVGIMQLPQGMAYAMLSEVPPVVGLYMSFFPVLVYFIFGTSRHVSMGTVAVISLLTGSVVAKFNLDTDTSSEIISSANLSSSLSLSGNSTVGINNNVKSAYLLTLQTKYGIVTTISFLVGATQILMGVLKLGFVTTYMSDPLISGFTTATAVHVGTSQIKYILGLKIPRTDGMFQVVKTYVFIIQRIADTNIPTLILSCICMFILYVVKEQINQRFKSKLKIPLPIELAVVIAAIVASYFGHFEESYKINVLGNVPAGLPEPALPSFKGIDAYITDIIVIAIISFAQSVSIATLMAKKHKYAIDSNQELFAYGAGNIFGSFFLCCPFAASVSRTSVQDSAGGKTQVASLFSAGLVLIVILWLGPTCESLPNCVLSSIILVALRSLLLQVLELPYIWKTSRYDFAIWVVTCLFATLLHVDYGLLIGLIFSFFTVVLRTQLAKTTILGKIKQANVYKDSTAYVKTIQENGIKIVGFNSPVFFANAGLFIKQVYRAMSIKPEDIQKHIRRALQIKVNVNKKSQIKTSSESILNTYSCEASSESLNCSVPEVDYFKQFPFKNTVSHIILDFSCVPFVDSVGCKIIKELIQDYESIYVTVFIASLADDIWNTFEATDLLPKYSKLVFLTLDDAVEAAQRFVKKERTDSFSYDKVTYM